MNIISVFGAELPAEYEFVDNNTVLGGSLEECLTYMQEIDGDARSEFAVDYGFIDAGGGRMVYKLVGHNIKVAGEAQNDA
jgi:hypothetical protein